MERIVHATPAALGEHVARDILARMALAPGRFLLGCPGGRSARPVYQALARLRPAPQLTIVMMDEYLERDGAALRLPDPARHFSCRGFAEREIAGPLGLDPAAIWLPDPADPAAYEARIADAGGIDLFLLASGAGDGHVAFNPPGSAIDSRTRVVALAEQTRRDNMATFPDFASLDQVPRHGVTVGIATIAAHSRAVAMLLWGAGKRTAFAQIGSGEGYDPQWPATVVRICREAVLHADRDAAG